MRTAYSTKKGFTLVELMVTLGIFVLMTALLLANQRRFSNTLELTNLAYDVSLSIRQAQTYGFAVKGQGGAVTTEFQNYYGINFDLTNNTKFIIFADAPSGGVRGKYDAGVDTLIVTYTLKSGYTFTNICNEDSTEVCYPNYTTNIVFKRPNPDASTSVYNANTLVASPGHIRIKIKSGDDRYKAVDVYKSGQIAVVDITS
jgi:prepilin-type N-terminal cleavage/methylation domain-containing protein